MACIQETHLNTNHRFSIRGYQTFRLDREGRHKGGVLILVRNNIAASDFKVDTNQQAEIHGVKITVDNSAINIFNLYCPPDKDLSLQHIHVPSQNCLAVGDFNGHSTSWGYGETDRRGDEVEDWQIENNMLLLNDPEDPPTFFSRRWISTSTPDLAFATEDLSRKTNRKVLSQLAGSDHRPVLLAINLQYRPSNPKTFPRWNYKKADWEMFHLALQMSTNKMLEHLGTKAKTKLLGIFNNSWKTGHVPQSWREADMVPIHKKGKDRANADSYRPISLTSCAGKLMERLINTRLVWHLEKNNIITPEQAGFRQHHSTEAQVKYIAQKIEDGFQDKQHTLTVWIDMEKAYDRVWKDGLRLKLQKSGVTGCMYQWISQYLTNRKARVHVNGTYIRKKTLKEGVPQGGVLSPTLFLVFINDIVGDMPCKVQGAIYADDLVLWCSEEYLSTANYRMQQALNTLEGWTNQWLVKINSRKTTYTIFSLSTKEQKATLHINGQTLLAEDNPTYLGVTFDKRLTWRQQTEKAEARAKVRLALMKKLAGTTWGADTVTLKRLYTGRVRPVLEYGMTAWGTTAKSNFDRVSKVQNQATRIITGAMKSTPIMELETITGLQSLDDRRGLKLLSQAAKFKRLQDHPMRQRLSQPTKGRLKRESFVHQSRMLERRQEDILDYDPKEIPPCLAVPAWSGQTSPVIRCTIPGVGQKDSQSGPERKSLTQEYLETNYPKESWTHGYTDGSAENAVRNGGAGVYIQYAGGKEDKISLATGLYSTNFKSEAEALKTAAAHIEASTHASLKVVLLTDALSVLQALQSNRDTEINDLSTALVSLCRRHEVTLQWIPSHCNLPGNEAADSLAKEGTTKEQVDRSTSYPEVKTILKAKQHSKWRHKHPRYNKADPYYLLTRREQVTVFRLRTGHNRLNYHLYSKLRIGHTEQCPCGTGSQTTEHLLQFCPTYEPLRKGIWPDHTPVARKLYGSLKDLRCTATFIEETGISI